MKNITWYCTPTEQIQSFSQPNAGLDPATYRLEVYRSSKLS